MLGVPIRVLCVSLFVGLLASSCATKNTKLAMFPKMYETPPLTVLVLPPMNESTSPEAKEFFECTLLPPLADRGYYVVPIGVANEVLKTEGAYDSEIIDEGMLSKFADLFGADAVLWTTIKEWDKMYAVLAANVEVSLEYRLQSTRTGEVLWSYVGSQKVDTSGDSGNAGGLAGLLVKAATAAVETAKTDYVPIARKVNVKVLDTLPAGQYHTMHNKDQKAKVEVK